MDFQSVMAITPFGEIKNAPGYISTEGISVEDYETLCQHLTVYLLNDFFQNNSIFRQIGEVQH